ncbi:MAG: O-acetylhomoserine aminocarboxypropyltransferase/cysteine synthase [Oscillospiraceae bacterium]|nr:O-acetylhomoserine aminocarboxypropyltransferase/cysteine synthase [Oscillospiraceae bacterium]
MTTNYGFDTLMVHAGHTPDKDTHSRMLPIYQTTAYTFDSAQHAQELFALKVPGNIYSRLSNPTVDAFEARINALENGVGALAFSSGHAAMFNTMINLASAGDEIVSSINIYGGAINLFGVTLRNLGINVKFVDPDDLAAWENAVTDKTKAFFVESVGNPNANIADLCAIADIAHKHGIPFIVDSTMTTPYFCRAFDFGADFIIHSATKYLGGHGTSMAGIVVDSGKFQFEGNPRFPQYNNPDPSYHGIVFAKDCGNAGFITRLRALVMRDIGSCLSPFNAFMIMMGVETLSLRMNKHASNTLAVAEFLEAHPLVEKVNCPVLKSSPYHERMLKYMPNGCGSTFTFELKGGRAAGAKFIDSLKLISHVANLGDTRTLVSHPASTTHSQLTDEQLKAAGISAGTVRLSIGIEDPKDIIADIQQAIEASSK